MTHPPYSSDNINDVRQTLNQGGVALLPTETVYGLAANAQSTAAVNRLYALKGRDFKKPIALCVKSWDAGQHLVKWSEAAESLTRYFWPGPLSIIMPARDGLNFDPRLFGRYPTGRRSLSLRCPDIDWRDQLGARTVRASLIQQISTRPMVCLARKSTPPFAVRPASMRRRRRLSPLMKRAAYVAS